MSQPNTTIRCEPTPVHAGATIPVLRPAVRVGRGPNGPLLVDDETGLHLVVGEDAAVLLATPTTQLAQRVDRAEVDAFVGQLRNLGLFEPATASEAAQLQGRYVLNASYEIEHDRIRATVEHAIRTTALHRECLGRVASAEAPWRLEDLPLLKKEQVRKHFPQGLVSNDVDLPKLLRDGDVVIATTSGTTGDRLQVYSDTRVPRLPADFLTFWRLDDLPSGRPVRTAVFTSPICSGISCALGQKTMRERVVFEHTLFLPSPRNPFRMTEQDVLRVLAEMAEFGADFWLVNPVYLAALVERVVELGHQFPPVRAVLTSYQYFSECQRRILSRRFAAPIFELYSATDLGGSQIGITCPYGRMHVRLDHVFVELVRDGRPVAPGDIGAVAVTSHNPTMPLVRYLLGDLARFELRPCACQVGSAWPVLTIEGRVRDTFVVGDRLVTTRDVDDCLKSIDLIAYQLAEIGLARYRLDAVVARGAGEWRPRACSALLHLLECEDIDLNEVSELTVDDSQKFRYTRPLEGCGASQLLRTRYGAA